MTEQEEFEFRLRLEQEQAAQAAQTAEPGTGQVAAQVAGAVAPAGMYGPTGLKELGQATMEAAQPLVEAGKSAAAGYAKSPGKAIVDVGAAHLGLPPPYATYEGIQGGRNLFGAAKQTIGNIGEALSKLPPGTDKAAAPFINELHPNDLNKLKNAINTEGLEKAFKTFEAPKYLSAEAAQGLNAVKSAFPTGMQKLGQVVAPLARGVAKVAGPAGMAYNLYEAGQTARDTQLGQRLAEGQGQRAEQAFRGGMGMTYQGPQLQPQEAQNVLQSGSARDIQYFGGRDRLSEMIRRKAAEKVLGPIAPGTF